MNDYSYKCELCGATALRAIEFVTTDPPYGTRFMELCDEHHKVVMAIAKGVGGKEAH